MLSEKADGTTRRKGRTVSRRYPDNVIWVVEAGEVYRVTLRQWRAYCRARSDRRDVDLCDYATPKGVVKYAIDDWTVQHFRDALAVVTGPRRDAIVERYML